MDGPSHVLVPFHLQIIHAWLGKTKHHLSEAGGEVLCTHPVIMSVSADNDKFSRKVQAT